MAEEFSPSGRRSTWLTRGLKPPRAPQSTPQALPQGQAEWDMYLSTRAPLTRLSRPAAEGTPASRPGHQNTAAGVGKRGNSRQLARKGLCSQARKFTGPGGRRA
ncbi:hypothetical protein MCOR02_006637 [Pyricularia oryzae]|nr:hypothetical protein MCOR02_006637 [Pyricularia oryzae]